MASTKLIVGLLTEDQWELDPLFRTFPKLFIQDILTMPPYDTGSTSNENGPGTFNYNNHPICSADVLGVIVKVYRRERCTIYDLDDGTGVVSCVCWKQGCSRPLLDTDQGLPPELKDKFEEVVGIQTKIDEGFNIGDLLHVRGKIKVYNGVRELMCSYHALVDDPNTETLRMVELVTIYRKHYDVPLTLPGVDENSKLDIETDSLRMMIESHIEQKQLQRVNAASLCKVLAEEYAEKGDLTEGLISKVMGSLEEKGFLFKSSSVKDHMVTDYNLDVQKETLAILKRECRKAKYIEQGCPMIRVLDELRTMLQYSQLQRSTVHRILLKLEEQSEVISLEPHYYQALDS